MVVACPFVSQLKRVSRAQPRRRGSGGGLPGAGGLYGLRQSRLPPGLRRLCPLSRLQPGRPYKLPARVKDGGVALPGARPATPPNPRLLIQVREDLSVPETPAAPARPAPGPDPGKGKGPAATLEPPVRPTPP